MKKMTYNEYELLNTQNSEQFSEMFDEFIDMENTADLKYQLDFDDVPGYFGIAARSEDSDVLQSGCLMLVANIFSTRLLFLKC